MKISYLRYQAVRAILAVLLLCVCILLLKVFVLDEYVSQTRLMEWLEKGDEVSFYILLSFFVSEATLGLLPPELITTPLAFLWKGEVWTYWTDIFLVSVASYGGGIVAYWIGRFMIRNRQYRKLLLIFMKKEFRSLLRYGKLLIVLAAITPIPFSLFCVLLGSLRYDFWTFVVFSLPRFLRISSYAYFIYYFANL